MLVFRFHHDCYWYIIFIPWEVSIVININNSRISNDVINSNFSEDARRIYPLLILILYRKCVYRRGDIQIKCKKFDYRWPFDTCVSHLRCVTNNLTCASINRSFLLVISFSWDTVSISAHPISWHHHPENASRLQSFSLCVDLFRIFWFLMFFAWAERIKCLIGPLVDCKVDWICRKIYE